MRKLLSILVIILLAISALSGQSEEKTRSQDVFETYIDLLFEEVEILEDKNMMLKGIGQLIKEVEMVLEAERDKRDLWGADDPRTANPHRRNHPP